MLTQKKLLRHKQLIIHRIYRFYLLKTKYSSMIQDKCNNGSFTTQNTNLCECSNKSDEILIDSTCCLLRHYHEDLVRSLY